MLKPRVEHVLLFREEVLKPMKKTVKTKENMFHKHKKVKWEEELTATCRSNERELRETSIANKLGVRRVECPQASCFTFDLKVGVSSSHFTSLYS